MTEIPSTLQVNAWAEPVGNRADVSGAATSNLLATGLALPDVSLAPKPIDPRNWRDDRVGWGVLLPDDPALGSGDKAKGADAPNVLQELIAERKGVVLRYSANAPLGTITRYYEDGTAQNIMFASQAFGTGVGKVPRYILIYADPDAIPWSFQFELQNSCFVGRLDLQSIELERYIEALRSNWSGSKAKTSHTLVWATDHNFSDITHVMRNAVAAPLHEAFAADGELSARFIDGMKTQATAAGLIEALVDHHPIFIATTSHGRTGPLDNVGQMSSDLGLPVDMDHQLIRPDVLTGAWDTGGAIWYAHACCSAGSSSATAFNGLVAGGSDVERILTGVAACGNTIAPLPRALLGGSQPLRAFVGHVEPTFDWSVRHNRTGQFLTTPLLTSFYQQLFLGDPIGLAMDACRRMSSGLLHAQFGLDRTELAQGTSRAGDILAMKLLAADWRAFVLLGDPTCSIVAGPGP
jgi:hypothetical protein